jgi:hypothetical protein
MTEVCHIIQTISPAIMVSWSFMTSISNLGEHLSRKILTYILLRLSHGTARILVSLSSSCLEKIKSITAYQHHTQVWEWCTSTIPNSCDIGNCSSFLMLWAWSMLKVRERGYFKCRDISDKQNWPIYQVDFEFHEN